MAKKILCWFFGVYFAVAALGGIIATVSGSGESQIFSAFLTIAFIFVAYFLIKTARKPKTPSKKERQQMAEQCAQEERQQKIIQVNNMVRLPVEENPTSVLLKPGEICYYQCAASVLVVKNETVGHTSGHSGISVRVAKGVTLHSGGGRGHAIKQNVTYKFPGFFTMTNQRILMTGEKGFDYPVEKLTALTEYTDGVGLQFGSKNYILTMDEPYWPNKILSLMRAGAPLEEKFPPITAQDIVSIHTERVDVDAEVETPEGAELSYLDVEALKFWNKKHTDFEIPPYYSETAFGRNVGPALKRLLDGGYLETGDIEERISLKTIPELKAVLADRELKVSGNKKELVYRIIDNFDEEEIEERFPVNVYKITEKGEKAADPYSIIEDNNAHALGISYYRLMKAKKEMPGEDNNVILTKLLSDDIQQCYKDQDRTRYHLVIEKTARFMREVDELELSFECYSLAFFMCTMDIKEQKLTGTGGQTYYMAKNLEESGKLCGYDLGKAMFTFQETIKRVNPFALGTMNNIDFSEQQFKSALGI